MPSVVYRNSLDDAVYNPDFEYPIGDSLWMDVFEYPNQPNQRPKTNVSWEEANATVPIQESDCVPFRSGNWGVEVSWDGRPYGDSFIDDLCNIGHPEGSLSGTHIGCQSSFGLQDMVGSVWNGQQPLSMPMFCVQIPLTSLKGTQRRFMVRGCFQRYL